MSLGDIKSFIKYKIFKGSLSILFSFKHFIIFFTKNGVILPSSNNFLILSNKSLSLSERIDLLLNIFPLSKFIILYSLECPVRSLSENVAVFEQSF